ncbi:class I SAM-dependent methyltransferase [Cellulomonas sp. S1-8]|uniref:class I SAM-dependent methyltransferase n=1 Tax=Cellulomonas sp. S1-8 TaxID=2904790 RepID=UPI002243E936|nr:class I SAM-dependent methyltransferase [Cellulomonas sp. S1-8]UZN03262.1 methyltransferase domain-containing protein [Cellulomonas sp. S1-8]
MFARVYDRMAPSMDRQGAAAHRHRLLAGLVGEVVEVGAGGGANFAHYPDGVVSVLALEPEPYLRDRAAQRADGARTRVRVVDATAEQIPVADGSADCVVACLVLCSVADQATALREMFRVLRPGGQLRFYEHVAATGGPLRTVQRIVDATVWPLVAGGCHTGRDTLAAIRAAGFVVGATDRFDLPSRYASPAAPHVLGHAVRP